MLKAVVFSLILAHGAISGTIFATVCDPHSNVPCSLESSESAASALSAAAVSGSLDTRLPRRLGSGKVAQMLTAELAEYSSIPRNESTLNFSPGRPIDADLKATRETDGKQNPWAGAIILLSLTALVVGTGAGNWSRQAFPK